MVRSRVAKDTEANERNMLQQVEQEATDKAMKVSEIKTQRKYSDRL